MLDGVRIIDLTSHLAGPYCTWLLAELGAEVIKVERASGDPARGVGPYSAGESLYFASINRNKRSVALDLKSPLGKEAFARLLGSADVLVENLRPGALARLGYTSEWLTDHCPDLIYASISGFGHTGPLRERPAFDIVVQAMGGMMSVTGAENGPPARVGMSIGDIAAGLFTAIDVLATLFAREREQPGKAGRRRIDVSMLDCQLALLENAVARHLNAGDIPRRLGSRHPSMAPFQALPTSDGSIVVAADGDALWAKFCRAIGLDALIDDPRFVRNDDRLANHAQLEPLLAAVLQGRTSAEWLERLAAADVPSGPINSVPEALAMPHVAARGMVTQVNRASGPPLRLVSSPIGPPGKTPVPPPRLGEHTDEILQALGYSPEQVAQIRGEANNSR